MKHGPSTGSLLIIGGNEDREGEMTILQRFLALSGGLDSPIAVITTASEIPDEVWDQYRTAFSHLGARKLSHIHFNSREDAADPEQLRGLTDAGGIFFTGGAQDRLLAFTGNTRAHDEIRRAYLERGACIAGTSAGASAMSRFMLQYGRAELEPEKGSIALGEGLGFIERIVVDQHFSERQRLPRLLSVVAERPELFGLGIDEDTALLVQPGRSLEVLGHGGLTVTDGSQAITNISDLEPHDCLRMVNVCLHVLPSGTIFSQQESDGSFDAPLPLQIFLSTLTQ
jgi:cyanophycinase